MLGVERPTLGTTDDCFGSSFPADRRLPRTARGRTSSINTIWRLSHGHCRLRPIRSELCDVPLSTIHAPCEFSGFGEDSPMRGRSGVRCGSSPGERVCLSARPEKTRNERPHRTRVKSGNDSANRNGAQTCARALFSRHCDALARRLDQRAAIFQSFAISANFGSLTPSNAFCAPAFSPLRFSAMPSSISALSASDRPPLAMAFCSAAEAFA